MTSPPPLWLPLHAPGAAPWALLPLLQQHAATMQMKTGIAQTRVMAVMAPALSGFGVQLSVVVPALAGVSVIMMAAAAST